MSCMSSFLYYNAELVQRESALQPASLKGDSPNTCWEALCYNDLPVSCANHFTDLGSWRILILFITNIYIGYQARIQDFLQWGGGGVNDGGVQGGAFGARADGGGSPLGLINIRLRYIASIEYSERLLLFNLFAIVKKFVEKKNWRSRAGAGVTTPNPPPPSGSAPGYFKCRFQRKTDYR